MYRVATGLGANASPSSEEVAEVVDEGQVAESGPGLGVRLDSRSGARMAADARELNLDQ